MGLDYEVLMREALALGDEAEAKGEVPVGALIVDEAGASLGRGFNQPISSHDPTAHAEIVALREAALTASNYRLPGATLIVTVEPCVMCAGALMNARLSRVVFGAREPKWGAFGSRVDVRDLSLNHKVEVIAGVLEEEAADKLRRFFRERRG